MTTRDDKPASKGEPHIVALRPRADLGERPLGGSAASAAT